MKRIIYAVVVLLVTLSSCVDLESEVYDKVNPGIFPKTEKDVEALVTAAAYGPFRSDYYSGIFTVAAGGLFTITEMTTDLGECQWNDAVWPDVLYQNFRPSSSGVTQFYGRRADISKMTMTFERMKEVQLSDGARARFESELHCGRGWLAYLLYDLYGPVPLATVEDLENPIGDKIIPRPTKEWMADYIETELKAALIGLPNVYAPSDANYGRFTKGLVYTLLMKFYMHESNWAKAEEVGRELMKPIYQYDLVPEYKDVFTLENERNSEIIWACIETRSTNMQLWLAHVLSSAYPTKNPNIQKWGGYRLPWAFYNTFEKNDKRLDVLVGDFQGTDGVHYNQGNPGTILIKGALPVKYGEDPVATGEESQVDLVVYRYADVLMLLSEAIVRKNNAVTQEAVDLLNRIRNRAGIKAYTLSDFTGAQDFYEKMLLNRGQELWFEGNRRSDLIRYGKYIEYARLYKGSTTTKAEFVLMPLPQSAIDESKGQVIQNLGY